MRWRWTAAIAAVLAVSGTLVGSVLSQEEGGAPAKQPPAKSRDGSPPADDALSPEAAAWIARMTPGDAHAKLAALAGEWTVTVRLWSGGGGRPAESTGRATFRMTLGDRYLEQEFSGGFMGPDYEGRGITGYDNEAREFVGVWMDNMRTEIAQFRGTMDAEGRITLARRSIGGGNDGRIETEVRTPLGRDGLRIECFVKEPGGATATRILEMVYSRRK